MIALNGRSLLSLSLTLSFFFSCFLTLPSRLISFSLAPSLPSPLLAAPPAITASTRTSASSLFHLLTITPSSVGLKSLPSYL